MADATLIHERRFFDGWSLGALAIAALVLLPIVCVAIMAVMPSSSDWGHLWSTTMPRYVSNSLILMASVGALATLIGAVEQRGIARNPVFLTQADLVAKLHEFGLRRAGNCRIIHYVHLIRLD